MRHQFDKQDDDEDGENLLGYNPQEKNDKGQESDYNDSFEIEHDADNDIMIDNNYSMCLICVVEKVTELFIAFIIQYFLEGDDLNNRLTHFVDILNISNKCGKFQKPYNYTLYITILI